MTGALFLLFAVAQAAWSTAHFQIEGVPTQREGSELGARLESARAQVLGRIRNVASPRDTARSFSVRVAGSTDEFVQRSGRPWHNAASWTRGRMELQPWNILERYRDLDGTLRHELVHAILEKQLRKVPAWLAEGTAMVVADHRPPGRAHTGPIRVADLSQAGAILTGGGSRARSEEAYALSYAAVKRLSSRLGMSELLVALSDIRKDDISALGSPEELNKLLSAP